VIFIEVKRVGESKYSHPIITEELKQYIITEYRNGRSATSLSNEIKLSQMKIGKLLKEWDVPEGYVARCFVILGYVNGEYPSVKPRKDGRYKIIE